MKRLLSTSVVLLVLAVGCGTLKDETAATINGHDISLAEVDAFAGTSYIDSIAQQTQVGLVRTGEGSTGTAKQRIALTLLIQTQLYVDAVKDNGSEVTGEDQDGAEQQIADFEKTNGAFDPLERKALSKYVSAQVALVRLVGTDRAAAVTPAEVEEYFNEHADEFGILTCVDGFAVTADQATAAQAAIDGGAGIQDILSNAALGAQPISQDGSEVCAPIGQVSEPTMAALIDEGAVGQWGSGVINDPTSGDLAVFILPNSREQATAQTPSVASEITAQLQQTADAAAQEKVTTGLAKFTQKAIDKAEVTIDPRLGTWDPTAPELVIAPPVPIMAGPPTTVPPDALGLTQG